MDENKLAPIAEYVKRKEDKAEDMPKIINAIFLRTRLDSKLIKLSDEAKEILKTKKIKKNIKLGQLFKLFDELEKIDIEGDKWTKILGITGGLGCLSFIIGFLTFFLSFFISMFIDNFWLIPATMIVLGAPIGIFFLIKMMIYKSIDLENDFRESIIPTIKRCKNKLILDKNREIDIDFDLTEIEVDENLIEKKNENENEICVFRNKGIKITLPFKDKGDVTLKVQKEITKTYMNEETYRNNRTSQNKRLLFQSGIIKITVSNSENKIREVIKFNKTKRFNSSIFYANSETIIEMIEEL